MIEKNKPKTMIPRAVDYRIKTKEGDNHIVCVCVRMCVIKVRKVKLTENIHTSSSPILVFPDVILLLPSVFVILDEVLGVELSFVRNSRSNNMATYTDMLARMVNAYLEN